jgi:hypothetical protein
MERININDFDHDMINSVINDLKYKSYCYNRKRSPEISPHKWAIIYGVEAYLYEIMYMEGK